MSSDVAVAIEAKGLCKVFPIYAKPHHRLLQLLFPRYGHAWGQEFVALRGISFEIPRGQTVGIVGRNGSGKSTLLQLICATLTPTTGQVSTVGRVAALLELGAGFNPDFTGRENVFLNGAVLGLTRSEVADRFADIEAFADIGSFIDQPVKSYSSGMYVRLAFAVAINATPDVLIVDEALSVGDEAFQRKCFARIESIRDSGATVLFVSHSASAVISLCDRALLIDKGELLLDGAPKDVVAKYQKLMFAPPERAQAVRDELRKALPDSHTQLGPKIDGGTAGAVLTPYFEEGMAPQSTFDYVERGATIHDPHLRTPAGVRVNVLVPGDEYLYTYEVAFTRSLRSVRCGMMIRTVTGIELAGAATSCSVDAIDAVTAGERLRVGISFRCLLAPGTYFLNAGVLGLIDGAEEFVARRIDAAMFKVMVAGERLATGLVDLEFRSSVRRPE